MNKFQFTHEKSKKERGIENHVSTPSYLAQLLTELLGIDKVEGKVIYDCCFGVGALSQFVNTEKNILIGDDREKEYLEQGQKNIPKAILFNHDVFQCYGPPCYQHLTSEKWKDKIEQFIQQRENELDPQQVQQEYDRLMANGYNNKTPEEIQKELTQVEQELRQKVLQILIKQEIEKKNKENHV